MRLPQRGAQSVRRLAFALAGESLLLVDHNGYAAECLKQLTLPTGHALTADELLAELLPALTQNDLPMLQGLESRLTTLEQGVLADDTDKFIHKMSAIRRELNRENRFYARMGAHKTVILKITIMASVRRDWEQNNGYLVKAGYPLFFCRHEKQ